jgi:uncharacterized protein YbjT (DUF2867 family)
MTGDRTILITGVTGNQGGAVAQALQGTGFHVRGLTRKPEGDRAAALSQSCLASRSRCYRKVMIAGAFRHAQSGRSK